MLFRSYPSLWGDISRQEIQRAAGVEHASMLILTMPEQYVVNQALEQARKLNPKLLCVARSTRAQYLPQLRSLGVAAVQPELEGGLEMVRQGLTLFGRDETEVRRIVGQLREELYAASAQEVGV